jgi:hypothetical protein
MADKKRKHWDRDNYFIIIDKDTGKVKVKDGHTTNYGKSQIDKNKDK